MAFIKDRYDGGELYGYVGKILRINLTDGTTSVMDSSKYLPDYLGGREACERIWWDEVKEPVTDAFSPANKILFMTGPGGATGLPANSRSMMCGVGSNMLPEQFTHGCAGGSIGAALKFAGYDGFIVEGKAEQPSYILIEDAKVRIMDASDVWGKFTLDTQQYFFDTLGKDYVSLVIGPAGENLMRNASVTTDMDSAFAKSGFGAVWGSKNLKAVVVRGTGIVPVSDPQAVLENRASPFHEKARTEPYVERTLDDPTFAYNELTNCYGCNEHDNCLMFNVADPYVEDGRIATCVKCIGGLAIVGHMKSEYYPFMRIHSRRQEVPGSYHWISWKQNDPDDPDIPFLLDIKSNYTLNMFEYNADFGKACNVLCTQLGMDKSDMFEWYFTWLAGAQKQGILEEAGIDFGFPVDFTSPEFAKNFLEMLAYRKGKWGQVFGEGMARAMRYIGKEKYADVLWREAHDSDTGEPIEVPISFEASWGCCNHWQGRGNEICPPYEWIHYALSNMIDNRDATANEHMHVWIDEYRSWNHDDLVHDMNFLAKCKEINDHAYLKDSFCGCEWRSPNITWDDQEAQFFSIATGIKVEQQDLYDEAGRARLLQRAILMRDHGRTRDMEVEEIYPWLTYPDPWGNTLTWDEWNDCVDNWYSMLGWDLATGWPLRETWDKAGLSDVADELEALGLMPDPNAPYVRKENPFEGHKRKAVA